MIVKIDSFYDVLSLITVLSYVYIIYIGDMLLLSGSVVTVFIHYIIKQITYGWYPPIFKRPDGATNCGIFNTGGVVDYKSGFPSGHVAAISFIMNSLLLNSRNSDIFNLFYYNVPAILVAYARVMKGCHNTIQVIAGYLLGYSVAYFIHPYKSYIYEYYSKIKQLCSKIKSDYIVD